MRHQMSHKTAKLTLLISLVEKIMETSNYHVFERVIRLYQILPRSPQPAICINELKERLSKKYYNELSQDRSLTKALQRDLRLLTLILSAGNLLRTDGKGNQPASFRLSQSACIERFKPELSLVLVMANTYLHQYLPYDIYEKVEGFFEAAEQQLKQHTTLEDWQNRIRFIHADYSPVHDEGLSFIHAGNIYHALLNKDYWLNAQYEREYDNKINHYILKPHGIINKGRKQFLIASKIVDNKSELRTFIISRFQEVEIIPEKLVVNVDEYDIDELVRNQEYEMAYFDREKVNLKIRCNDEMLGKVEENPFDNDQNIEKTHHGYFYLIAQVMITQTVLDWLISKSHSVKVIEPRELYHRVRRKVVMAADLYEIELDINNDEEYPLEADHLSDEMKDHSDSYDFDDSDLDEDWNIGESEQRMAASHQYLETRWENTKKKKLLKKSIIIQQDDER